MDASKYCFVVLLLCKINGIIAPDIQFEGVPGSIISGLRLLKFPTLRVLEELFRFIQPVEMLKNEFFRKIRTRNNVHKDKDVVYAVPAPDGKGYILKNYHKPKEYDDNVDIKERRNGFTGNFKIPNLLGTPDQIFDSYTHPRIVRGYDGRYGLRAKIPFLGDIQYLREMGPGRFTEDLGPGHFTYPGINVIKEKLYHQAQKGHGQHDHHPHHEHHGHGHHKGGFHHSPNSLIKGKSRRKDAKFSGSHKNYRYSDDFYAKEEKADPLKELRNYPWNS